MKKDDKKDIISAIMNPVRQRIIQCIGMHGKGTAGEIGEALSDIPTASLYRHIKVLSDIGFLEVCEERQVRGAVEKTYALAKQPMGNMLEEKDLAVLIQSSLISLLTSFQQYFAEEGNDPVKDLLGVSTSTLMLSDEEFGELMEKIGQLLSGYLCNKPDTGRSQRRFTIISSPCEK